MALLASFRDAVAAGSPVGITSVCSAHPLVLRAALRQARRDGTPLLIEATSNQVNQEGGYTGMRPADFRDLVYSLARREGVAPEVIILGGDHLGPNPWQDRPAEEAMRLAEAMVREYSEAGFAKIHLDASMACADDRAPLSDAIVAERAARLCRASEDGCGGEPRFYVIGTEVPVPGGATEALTGLQVTSEAHATQTLAVHREVFVAAGLAEVWPRVLALVVQPGVEFNHDSVVDFDVNKARHLRGPLQSIPGLVYEAHSTDYQRPSAYPELVRNGFAILKVGPALTFAMREALFALERVEAEMLPEGRRSRLAAVVEEQMLKHPAQWAKHYHGDAETQRLLRRYSYSDRLRYYWTNPAVDAAYKTLMRNLDGVRIPETLLSAHLPEGYLAVRDEGMPPDPELLVLHRIGLALAPYAAAGMYRLAEGGSGTKVRP